MEDEGSSVRLVRCPKCENLLPELPQFSVYQCGCCGAVLRGKLSTPASEKRSLEKSDNSIRVESSKKVPNFTASSSSRNEKHEIFTDYGQSRRRRLDFDQTNYGVSREVNHSFAHVRSRPIGFHRNVSTVAKGKFGNLPYSNEGPSSSHLNSFNSFGNHIINHDGLHELSRVQDLENDRTALLKKIDELRTQLSRTWVTWPHQPLMPHQLPPMPRQPPPMPHQPLHHQYLPPVYHDPYLHQPSCSCSQCYNMNWQPNPPKIHPYSFYKSQPEPLTYGPRQMPHHHARSIDLKNGSFVRRYPRRRLILRYGSELISQPVSGGAPFISCCNCFELLKIPKKLRFSESNCNNTIKCAVCSCIISLRLEDNKMIASVSSSIIQQKVNERKSNKSSPDYDKCGYNFQLTDANPNLSTSGAEKRVTQSPNSVTESQNDELSTSPNDELSKNQNDDLSKSQTTDQERVIVDQYTIKNFVKDALVTSEIDVSLNEYLNCDVSIQDDRLKGKKDVSESFFAGLIKKRLKDFSRSSSGVEKLRSDVFVNGQLLTDHKVKNAEKLAGPIHPGEYWYDSIAGFWGVMNQPCFGIIPPFIEEFDYPLPKNCAAGNTGVFVNGRELNQKDLDLLVNRGLPTTKDRSYIIDIFGKVVDEDTGEELDGLGKLAPTVEKVNHGFGMKVPKSVSK